MSQAQEQLETGIAALEAQRAVLGDAIVDISVAAMRARLTALQAAAAAPEASQTLKQVSILFLAVLPANPAGTTFDPEDSSNVIDGTLTRGTATIEAHGGKVLQYAGDSLLAAFGSAEAREDDAERAVRAGLDLLALQPGAGAAVRVGIHTGGVLLGGGVDEDGTIRGLAVNIAARMEQTAPAGALRISHETYAQVRGVFDVLPQEPLAVKGMNTPVLSYLVQRAKPRAFRVTTRGIEGVTTRMIGRDVELEVLQDAFKAVVQPGAGLRRVFVVAEAGIGKSRLLYEFQNWAEARPEVFFLFQARATPQTQGQPYGLLRDLLAWRLQISDGDSMDTARRKLEKGLMPLFVPDEGEREAEAHAHLLGHLIGLDYNDSRHISGIRDDARQIRNRGFFAAAQALRRMGAQGGAGGAGRGTAPIVVHLDDLQWADDASLDFVDYMAQVNRDVPMLLLGLTRPTYFERRVGAAGAASSDTERRVDLLPLDKTGSRLLANELLKKLPEVPAVLRELLTGGAEGNPFYMEELVKMLVDQGAIDTRGEHWALDADRLLALKVPPTLTGVLQARLDGLPAAERHALQLASVIGLNFWDQALAHVEPAAARLLPALARRELVRPTEIADTVGDGIREYAFTHQLLHQVTYDTVLKRIKREAHAKTADWLALHSGTRAKTLLGAAAEHYERAGDTANAAEYYTRAAEHMASIFANDAALHDTERALKLAAENAPGHGMLRWRLLANRERTLDLLGRRSEQLQDIEALMQLAETLPTDAGDADTRRAEAAWRRCDIAMRTGDWATMEREARRAQQLAERASAEELVLRAMQRLAAAVAYQGNPAAGRPIAEAGLARAQALGWLVSQARLANAAAVCAQQQGDQVACLRYNALSLALSREAGNRRSEALDLGNVGMGYLCLGDYVQARLQLEEALRLNRALGNREVEGNVLCALSELAWRQGRDALALTQAQAALAITVEVSSRLYQTIALWSLGNAELALGRYAQAHSAFVQSEVVSREIGSPAFVLNALDGQARVALARGDLAGAQRAAMRLLDEATAQQADAAANPFAGANEHLIRLTLHQVWRRSGDPRAEAALVAAQRALQAEADAISDAALSSSFLNNVPEHREIMALVVAQGREQPA